MSLYRAVLSRKPRCCKKSFGLGASQVLNLGSPRSIAFHATGQFPRHIGTVPTSTPPQAEQTLYEIKRDMSTITEVIGDSGRRYLIQRVLQDKGPPHCAESILPRLCS